MKKVVEIELKICHRLLNRPLKGLKWHTLNPLIPNLSNIFVNLVYDFLRTINESYCDIAADRIIQ